MALETREQYKVATLVTHDVSALRNIAEMMKTSKMRSKGFLLLRAQHAINWLILLEGEKYPWITPDRHILINQGADVMTSRPQLAPVVAAGFKNT